MAEQQLTFEPAHFAGCHSLTVFYMPNRHDRGVLSITLRPASGTSATPPPVELYHPSHGGPPAAMLRKVDRVVAPPSTLGWSPGMPQVEVTEEG